MKKAILLFLIVLTSSVVFSQEYKESELPAQVINSFKEKFTPQGKVVWTKSSGNFIATFKTDNQTTKSVFTPEGKCTETLYQIDYKELPGDIITYISANFKDAKIKESAMRETPGENDHYYISLKKEGVDALAEITFDLKGALLNQKVPDAFFATPSGNNSTAAKIPPAVLSAFKLKAPEAAILSWKQDTTTYLATYTEEQQKKYAAFDWEGNWIYTKADILEKELPGMIINHFKQNYKGSKIKVSQLIEEPAQSTYYLFIKKEGVGQGTLELYYTITGKFIKKVVPASSKNDADAFINEDNKNSEKDKVTDQVEKVNIKELPSPIKTYINQKYKNYSIKDAIYSSTEEGTFYYVNIKKEGSKQLIKLCFDIKGKFVEIKKDE